MENPIVYKHNFAGNKVSAISPAHKMVSNWVFNDGEEDEAALCHHMAKVAEKSGMNANDMHALFPALLRMLKSEIEWAGQNKK